MIPAAGSISSSSPEQRKNPSGMEGAIMPDYTHDAPLTSKGSVTDEEWGLGSSGRADSQDTSSKTGAGPSTASLISTNTREGSTIAHSLAHSVSADIGQVAAPASDCLGDGIVGVGEEQPWQSDAEKDAH